MSTPSRGAKATGYRQTIVISDTQYPFVDEAAEKAVMDYVADAEPDQIIQIGDFADFYSLASFDKKISPSQRLHLQEEVEVSRRKLRDWAGLVPKRTKKVLIEGNHEARVARYLEQQGGEFFDLSELSVSSLLRVEDAGWDYVGPYGAGTWVGLPGGLWATHGDFARKWSADSAQAHLTKYGHSVIHGHTHRLGAFFQTLQGADGPRMLGAYEVGCLCDFDTTPRASMSNDWQLGIATVWTSKTSPRFHVDLHAIVDGGFVAGGRRYGR